MKTREIFEEIRGRKDQKFSLRLRLTLLVTTEITLCVLLGSGVDQLLQRFWDIPQVVELLVISLLVGFLVTWVMAKFVFDPIKKLGKAMEQVADGDFSVRLESKSNSKEIQEVYSGFNLMTYELSNTEILQSDFVSNVSHEFKTPISAIEGYSTLLQGSEGLDDQQKEYVEKILFNTQRLSNLVGNILILSRIENQSIPTGQNRFRLDEQIRQSIVMLEPMWERKELEPDVELEELQYYGNESLLHHVWDNLISNAIKFDPPGGLLRIRLKRQGESIAFTVEDSGPGIPEEARKHIFDKFYQADSSHKQEGNGLGLALVRQIVNLEQGSVTAENTEQGSRFTVILKQK